MLHEPAGTDLPQFLCCVHDVASAVWKLVSLEWTYQNTEFIAMSSGQYKPRLCVIFPFATCYSAIKIVVILFYIRNILNYFFYVFALRNNCLIYPELDA
jgi:hypothetical protein